METLNVAAWVLRGRYTRVALQFPPELLALAPAELLALAAALQPPAAAQPAPAVRLFLVGDTAFSPCCIDEVAAAHYSADAVVHYGPTCLTRTRALPAFHVLGPAAGALDAAACGAALWAQAEAAAAQGQRALLVWDTAMTAGLGGVLAAAAAAGAGSAAAVAAAAAAAPTPEAEEGGADTVRWASPHPCLFIPACPRAFPGAAAGAVAAQGQPPPRAVCGLSLADLPPHPAGMRVIYLGSAPARERVLVGQLGGCAGGVWRLDPATGACQPTAGAAQHARLLASRYRLVGLLKGAGSVGLVAGTLAVEGHVELLAMLKRALEAAGKAVYTFLVGKVTPAKLANFHGTCDVFVLVACPEASLLEEGAARSHAVPVATPHEALVALEELALEGAAEEAEQAAAAAGAGGGTARQETEELKETEEKLEQQLAWDGTLLLSFGALMERAQGSACLARAAAAAALARQHAAAAAAGAAAQASSTALLDPMAGAGGGRALVAAGGSGEAAKRLLAREWQGLAYDTPEAIASAAPVISEGRFGRAAGYDGGR